MPRAESLTWPSAVQQKIDIVVLDWRIHRLGAETFLERNGPASFDGLDSRPSVAQDPRHMTAFVGSFVSLLCILESTTCT